MTRLAKAIIALPILLLFQSSAIAACPCFNAAMLSHAVKNRPESICMQRETVERWGRMGRIKAMGIKDLSNFVAYVQINHTGRRQSVVRCGFNGNYARPTCNCRSGKWQAAHQNIRRRVVNSPGVYEQCKREIVYACMARGLRFR